MWNSVVDNIEVMYGHHIVTLDDHCCGLIEWLGNEIKNDKKMNSGTELKWTKDS